MSQQVKEFPNRLTPLGGSAVSLPISGYGESPFAIHFRTNVAVKAAKAVHKG